MRLSASGAIRNEHENAKEFVNRIRRGYKAFLKPMPKQSTGTPAAPIRLSTNTIWEGKFYNRGEALPVASVADLTENLRPLVVTGEPDADEDEPNEPRGSFETGVICEMTPDGRLGRALKRKVERQVAQLEAENAQEEWLEEQVAEAELPPEIAEGLQEEHRRHVGLQAAQLAADASRSDAASDAAEEASAVPRMYVKRGGRHYAPTKQGSNRARMFS
jgi:hypothetical protein